VNEQKEQRSRSPSPSNEQKEARSRSASPATEQKEQRSRSQSPAIEQKEEKSQSSSLINEEKQEQSQPASSVSGQNPERSRSSSPNNEHNQQSNRFPLSNADQNSQRNQSTSVIIEQKHERSRSPSPSVEQNYQRSRSPSPVFEEKQAGNLASSSSFNDNNERSLSRLVSVEQNHERNRFSSFNAEQEEERSQSLTSLSLNEQKEQRSQSPSLTAQLEQQSNRSVSPTNEGEQQRSRSPSPTTEQSEQRSRSPSPNIDQKLERSRSSLSMHEDQRKDSFSVEPLANKPDFADNENSLSKISDDHEIETQAANKVIDNQQKQQSDTPASPKLEESKSPRLSTNFYSDTTHHLPENVAPLPMIEQKQEKRSRSPSPTISEKSNQDHENLPTSLTALSPKNENDLFVNEQYKSQETDKNEPLKKSLLSSPLIEKRVEDPLLISSPTDRHGTSFVKTRKENEISPLVSPSMASFAENHSSQALKSPVNDSISSATLKKQDTSSDILTINQEQVNLSHSATQPSSFDHHHESNPSPIPLPPVVRQLSITRSQSQSTIVRPNTLPFSPNNHDLDGLYTSNDYNDEDEIPEDSEYHHHSAPSTVTVEYRRSSLINNSTIDQRQTPIDPNDISRRLSIVEKSRMEGILYTLNNGDIFTVLGIYLFFFPSPLPHYYFFWEYGCFYFTHHQHLSHIHFFLFICR
jgi:hypothetical protein